jgi:predicted RNase H-like nuclease (RuvC/YqgF family)
MARQSKIEKFGCKEIVAAGLRTDPPKTLREIAEECSEWAGEKISHTAVARYIESLEQQEQKQKKEVIKQDQRRVVKHVNQEFDIIHLQYQTTEKLLKRFEMVDNLPEYFKEQMEELVVRLMTRGEDFKYVSYLERWQTNVEVELRRKVYEITSLNRELRENSKFLAELREKAFEFSLIQEYLSIFMDIFKEASPEGYEVAIQKVAANPRMQKIVDQQMQLRSDG